MVSASKTCWYLIFNLSLLWHSQQTATHDEDKRQMPAFLPESYMTVVQMIEALGYSVNTYNVKTPDGYILQVLRIPSPKQILPVAGPSKKLPVLLLHGIFCSAAEFTNNFESQSLSYVLVNNDYDVWMINFRGNVYSSQSENYNDAAPEFWDFSFDEMAKYDLPTVIDFILNATSHKQVYLIGHSMGTTVPYAMLSTYQEYNKKVRAIYALSSTIFMRFSRGIVTMLPSTEFALNGLSLINVNGILPQNMVWTTIVNTMCNGLQVMMCEMFINALLGDQPGCLNKTRIPVYLSHFPAGTSSKNLKHFYQIMRQQVFKKYDHGKEGNLRRYNQTTPPVYDMKKVSSPVHLYYIDGDYFCNGKETDFVASQLGNVAGVHNVAQDKCGHMWLVWGMETAQKLYKDIIKNMDTDMEHNLYSPK